MKYFLSVVPEIKALANAEVEADVNRASLSSCRNKKAARRSFRQYCFFFRMEKIGGSLSYPVLQVWQIRVIKRRFKERW